MVPKREYTTCPKFTLDIENENSLLIQFTEACHVYVEARHGHHRGFEFRGKAYTATAHLYLSEDGVWGFRDEKSDLFCPDVALRAARGLFQRIKNTFLTEVPCFLESPSGQDYRRNAELAHVNNFIGNWEEHRQELLAELHRYDTAITTYAARERLAQNGQIPAFYIDTPNPKDA